MAITEKMTVIQVLKNSQNTKNVFKKYNLYCTGCRGNTEDTIEKVAINNGLDVASFVKELNKAAEK